MRLSAVLRPLADTLVHSHLWIGAGALCLGLYSYAALGRTIEYTPFWLLILAGTVLSYTLMRVVRGRRDRRRVPLTWFLMGGVACMLTIWSTIQLPVDLLPWMLLGGLGALLYIFPIGGGRRFRDIPFLKVWYIALLWTYATLLLPIVYAEAAPNVLWLASRYLFIMGITLPFDIRDMDQDGREHVWTLPRWIGWRHTRRIAVGCLVLSLAGLIILASEDAPNNLSPYWAEAGAVLWAGIKVARMHRRMPARFYGFELDGLLLVPLLLYSVGRLWLC